MKKLWLWLALLFALTFAVSSQAQEFDGAFGFGTVKAPAASNGFPSLSGGLYPSFSGIFRLHKHIGFGGEVSWRGKQALYGANNGTSFFVVPYRPIFYDFNAVYGATMKKSRIGADVMAGIGGEDLRFYQSFYSCGAFSCTNYQASNHFAWHFGGDVRVYVWGHVFVRPEAHYYVVRNNVEFNNVNASRFAVSIGYTFMPGF